MLIEFRVENYRSFREPATLSLAATKTAGPEEGVRDEGGLRLSTVAAIYGANASGKSNLINAFGAGVDFIRNSAREGQARDPVPVVPFALDVVSGQRPTEFEYVFHHGGVRYRYGFRADRARVLEEWLYHRPTQREAPMFAREGDAITLHRSFRGGAGLIERTRPNALFLSVAAQFNSRTALHLTEWFHSIRVIHGIEDAESPVIAAELLDDSEAASEIIRFVSRWDPGVRSIYASTRRPAMGEPLWVPAGPKDPGGAATSVVVRRARRDEDGNVNGYTDLSLEDDESEGLQKLFSLAVPVIGALRYRQTLVVDELDARLHPLITQALIRLFLSGEANSNNAQLIFATHDTNLLDPKLLRRDQIWFTERDRRGASHLYSLVEFMPRRNGQYERDYIEGRYGAIPFIGEMRALVEPRNAS